jgi:type IV pilus assembly protein PilY1
MAIHNRALRVGIPALLALGLLLPATTGEADDSDLFTTVSVDPNVLVLIDNSASMNHIIWHPSFDANTTYDCNLTTHPSAPTQAFDPNTTYLFTADVTVTVCNRTRTIFHDNKASQDPFDNKRYTRYDGRYLNWLFSSQADTAYTEISANNNGFPSSCVGGTSFAKYQRTRMNVAKQVLKDVVCQVNLVGNVRFGIAVFRNMDNSGADDPNGGYVIEPIDTPTSNQQADLVSAIQSIGPVPVLHLLHAAGRRRHALGRERHLPTLRVQYEQLRGGRKLQLERQRRSAGPGPVLVPEELRHHRDRR